MTRLAVAIDAELTLRSDVIAVALPARIADQLYRRRLEPVLLYSPTEGGDASFHGIGRLIGLSFPEDKAAVTRAVIGLSQGFATPVPVSGLVRLPRERQVLTIAEEQFEEIARRGTERKRAASLLQEAAARFAGTGDGGARHLAIYREVLADYRYRCPFTGHQSANATPPHPMLHVEAIWPLESGGALRRENFLPMTADTQLAWRAGHLTLSADLAFIVDHARIDPRLMARLLPGGRLERPPDGRPLPDAESLAFHRTQIFLHQSRLRE